ncbi:hypothetical protein CLU86_1835 [Acidovorax sp. 62]|uniref:hypothetical protein n=1 Tax=Acidovorax sp. 62 TaxID=2035203 RepID=UPI000C18D09E|nr:hypothetical protein [Acidovorax sp. 62]PIF90938.1 hypothetical protein CLU86_1835 [Acidovorax sp. 62]
MSLDFILIKTHGRPSSVDEIEADEEFDGAAYARLAERLFGPLEWAGSSSIAAQEEMSFELTANDTSLPVTARGPGDTVAYMENIATQALDEKVVTVELVGSEILVPLSIR